MGGSTDAEGEGVLLQQGLVCKELLQKGSLGEGVERQDQRRGKARPSCSEGGCSLVCQLHLPSLILKQRSSVVVTLTLLRHWLPVTPPPKYTGIFRSLLGNVSSHSLKTFFQRITAGASLEGNHMQACGTWGRHTQK